MYQIAKNTAKIILTILVFTTAIQTATARIIFADDVFENNSETFEIGTNDDSLTTTLAINFGGINPENITWNTSAFSFSDDIDMNQNELIQPVIENLSTPPTSPVEGQIYHNTTDGNTYIYSGSGWEDITAVSSTSTKVVTVGTGLDYSTIASAATYLNGLSGGIMLLSAETHSITSAVDLTNITLIGKDANQTTIQISGSGQIDAYDTRFVYLTLDINTITDDMAIDIQSGSSSIQFEWVDFDVQDNGDSLIDSNAGTAPTTSITFINCDETGGSGTILKTQTLENLNASSEIFVSSASGNNLLQLDDWDVTIEGSGNVYTTGTITTIPSETIFVYPGMNLQGAIDSLITGGSITILPGTHSISQPLTITTDNIEIKGYGDASVISASGFSSTGETIGAIQVGAANGSAPADGVVLKNFKVEVSSPIHGIRVTGGSDNQIENVTVQKISGAGGSGSSADIGIQMIDGTSEQLIRPVVRNSRILGNGGSNYFTDGIHISSDGSISGVWGNGQGVSNALVEGNDVDYVRETGYVFLGVDDSSLFNNRASRMSIGSGAFGIYMGNLTNINMNANVFSNSQNSGGIAIGIDSYAATTSSTIDSIFNNNIIDGTSDGGLGFATGFQIGGSNATVHRNSFQNNTIKGAATGTTIAIDVSGNSDDNNFVNNDLAGGTNAWDTGIVLDASTQDRTLIRGNIDSNVTTLLSDNGTGTVIGVSHHRSTSNPTINDDANDGYSTGTIWINTTNDTSYILVDDSVGAAIWNQIDGSSSGNTIVVGSFYDSNGGTNVNVSTPVSIGWNQETREDSGITHSTTTNNSRVTLDNAGWYEVTYNISHEDQTTARKNIRCRIRLNGTTYVTPSDSYAYSRNTTDEWATNTATAIFQTTNTNEYYEIVCNGEGSGVNSAAANTVASQSWTKVEKMGGTLSSTVTLDDAYNNGASERTISVDDGDVSWDISSAYNFIVDLQGTGDFQIQDNGTLFAELTDGGDFNLYNNLTVGSPTETISNANFSLNGDDVFIADSLGVEGAIYTDHTETKYEWLDLNGAVKVNVRTGTKLSRRLPVQRLRNNINSKLEWTFPVPDDWISGTDISITVFWSPSSSTSGNVVWQVSSASLPDGDTVTAGDFATTTTTEAANGTVNKIQTETFTISNTVLAADEMIIIDIARDGANASDTYGDDIDVHKVRIEYTGKKLL